MLDVRRFSCSPGGTPLLREVDFSIHSGEYVAVIGPNGVGKTTLLRAIDLIRNDWSGDISLRGRSIRDIPRKEIARTIACVQQIPPIFFQLSVRRLVAMGRYPRLDPFALPAADDERRIDEAMARTGVAPLAEREISTLSGGERQKALLAAALAQEPEIMLLDEPATFLDYRHQEETAALLSEINRTSGVTMIEVTHDLNRVSMENRRVIALAGGRIAFDGPASEMMNEKTLFEIFGVRPPLVRHPLTGAKMILPSGGAF